MQEERSREKERKERKWDRKEKKKDEEKWDQERQRKEGGETGNGKTKEATAQTCFARKKKSHNRLK